MSWFRVDDALEGHPKVLALLEKRGGHRALAVWLLCGSWASGKSPDGDVPLSALKRQGGRRADAEALVAVGLWEKVRTGYRFHDWADYRPKSDADRARRYRERKRHGPSRDASQPPITDALDTIPVPSRPDPKPDPSVSGTPFSGPPVPRVQAPDHTLTLAQSFAHEINANRPPGCRSYGGRDEMAAIADMLQAHGLDQCRAVVRAVARRIGSDLSSEDWSKLWAKGGTIFHVRLSELESKTGKSDGVGSEEHRRKFAAQLAELAKRKKVDDGE